MNGAKGEKGDPGDAIRVGRAEAKSGIVHLATFKSDAIRVGRAEAKA